MLMRCILLVYVFLYSHLLLAAAPILAIYGASTSGKTTLISQLKKELKLPHVELGIDLQTSKMLKQLENSEYADLYKKVHTFISSYEIFTALVRNEVEIRRGGITYVISVLGDWEEVERRARSKGIRLNEKEKTGIQDLRELLWNSYDVFHIDDLSYERVYIEMFREAVREARAGKRVFIDMTPLVFENFNVDDLFRRVMREESFEGDAKLVLVLCPFKQLSDRLAKRNARARKFGQYTELRAGVFPFFQYAALFSAVGLFASKTVDSLNYKDLVTAIHSMVSNDSSERIIGRLAEKLGVDDQEKDFFIKPKIDHDFLFVNDRMESIQETVSILMNFLI